MLSNYLKRALALSVVTAVILGFLLSCENPFSNNMGEKVVRALPTLTVESPRIGSFIPATDAMGKPEETVTFTGSATADRQLQKVQVRILPDDKKFTPLPDWTDQLVVLDTPSETESTWSFELDTIKFNDPLSTREVPLFNDGMFKIQFRAVDNAGNFGEGTEAVYIMKNFGPETLMTFPSITVPPDSTTPRRETGNYIRIQGIDIRTIHPDYPQIKIWPTTMPEPVDTDTNWGYAKMFRTGFDDPVGWSGNETFATSGAQAKPSSSKDEGEGFYVERGLDLLIASQFEFKLDTYTINAVDRTVKYNHAADTVNFAGAHRHAPLDHNVRYYVRIKTADAEIDEELRVIIPDENNDINPKNWSFFPPLNFRDDNPENDDSRVMGDPLLMELIKPQNSPTIKISNIDIWDEVDNNTPGGEATLKTRPNKFYVDPNSSKIFIQGTDPNKVHFRFQVKAQHSELPITHAILQLHHAGQDGYLLWDNTRYPSPGTGWTLHNPNSLGTGYVNNGSDSARAINGHRGWAWGTDESTTAYFTFTAKETNQWFRAGTGAVISTTPFESSREYYDLTVTAHVTGDTLPASDTWKVFLDGIGPEVRIVSIKGATDEPSGDFGTLDNAVNSRPYIVNGSIEVSINRSDATSEIMPYTNLDTGDSNYMGPQPPAQYLGSRFPTNGNGFPMVKWVIELKTPSDTDSMLSQLNKYRSDPTKDNLKFFEDITANAEGTRGWVRSPEDGGNFALSTWRPDNPSLPFEQQTNTWNGPGKELWLYVIAQDRVQNLGFIMQKIEVNDALDKPGLVVNPLLYATTDTNPITLKTNLDASVTRTVTPTTINSVSVNVVNDNGRDASGNIIRTGNWDPRRNILEYSETIELEFTDDDGISPLPAGNSTTPNITITLTDLNASTSGTTSSPLNAAQLVTLLGEPNQAALRVSKTSWLGKLTPELMATMLTGSSLANPARLRSGLYRLDVKVVDNAGVKVALPGETTRTADAEKSYFFAVYTAGTTVNDRPAINVTSPEQGDLIKDPIVIEGTVSSHLMIRNLWITFDPDVLANVPTAKKTLELNLYTDAACTQLATTADFNSMNAASRLYTYYWKTPFPVDFSGGASFSSSQRDFTVEAFDRLGNMNDVSRRVRVDPDPPDLSMAMFDNNRSTTSNPISPNGKVEFRIIATDASGLKENTISSVRYPALKWWILPSGTYAFDPDTGAITNATAKEVWERTRTAPATDDDNSWIIQNPVNGQGFGQRFRADDQETSGGYLGVFDSRSPALTPGASYQLVVAAVDMASNYAAKVLRTFVVNQADDEPKMGDTPPVPSIPPSPTEPQKRAGIKSLSTLVFSGVVRDDDRFDPDRLPKESDYYDQDFNYATLFPTNQATYVQIRFPTSVTFNPTTGEPTSITWGTWRNLPGTVDSSGAIRYYLRPSSIKTSAGFASMFGTYLNSDGTKYYQIRVSDEMDAPPASVTTRTFFGKNPRRVGNAAAAAETAANQIIGSQTANNQITGIQANGTDQISNNTRLIGITRKILPSDTGYYEFRLDSNQPTITFFKNDPNYDPAATVPGLVVNNQPVLIYPASKYPSASHPKERPVYTNVNTLITDMKGEVIEPNLNTLVIQFGDFARRTLKVNNADGRTEARGWDIAETLVYDVYDDDGDYVETRTETFMESRDRFVDEFARAAQGPHNVNLTAVDHAGNPRFVPWMFYKDTRGPDVAPSSFSRAILHTIPPQGFLPENWPLDWPYGSEWRTQTAPAVGDPNYADKLADYEKWVALRDTYGVADWPSSFAFYFDDPDGAPPPVLKREAKIINALTAENTAAQNPNVVSGDPPSLKNVQGHTYLPPTIRGSFQDEFSPIWERNAQGNVTKQFEYRFNVVGGRAVDTDTGPNAWHKATILPPVVGQSSTTAIWELTVEPTAYDGPDGLVTLDIRITDGLNNKADVYGLLFRLDRADPYFFGKFDQANKPDLATQNNHENIMLNYTPSTPAWITVTDEAQRVLSSDGSGGTETDPVFQLTGYVYDENFSSLSAVISQEGGLYTTGVTYEKEPDTYTYTPIGGIHFAVAPHGSIPYVHEWTLTIQKKAVVGLRTSTNANDGTRHFVKLTTTDMAGRSNTDPVQWNFYLDTVKPVIEYTNLEGAAQPSFFGADSFALQGIAKDDTGIQDVRFTIAKWDYAYNTGAGGWFWYDESTSLWNLPVPIAEELWPEANLVRSRTSVNWSISSDMLKANGVGYNSNTGWDEGKYRLDLVVTDWSLGLGNPNKTYVTPGAVGVDARAFFIDTADPTIVWVDESKSYYGSDPVTKQISFNLRVKDANTIKSVSAEVKLANGEKVTEFWADNASFPGNFTSGNAWDTDERTVVVSPFMTSNGTSGGTRLMTLETYVISLLVEDQAGRFASYDTTRQFNLDNTPPVVELTDILPKVVSQLPAAVPIRTAERAVTGSISITGNATDNSNRFNKVAFYVRNSASATPWSSISPNADGWHYYAGGENATNPGGDIYYRVVDKDTANPAVPETTLMEIGAGTFAWEIKIPDTRRFPENWAGTSTRPAYALWGRVRTGTTVITNDPTTTYFDRTTVSQYGSPLDYIANNLSVGRLLIDVLVEDMAGNIVVQELTYWIYPEGDRPYTNISNPSETVAEAQRMLNGNIRISGTAEDNERVHLVYFRVLDTTTNTPYTITVPKWKENMIPGTNIPDGTYDWDGTPDVGSQTAKTNAALGITMPSSEPDGGWYMANRGGDANTQANWWAVINTAGEFNLPVGQINRIKIQVLVSDATRQPGEENWDSGSSKLSAVKEVIASVVTGAPNFGLEQVKLGRSELANVGDWTDANNASVKRRAAYRIVVKNKTGVSSIRWARTRWHRSRGQFVRIGPSYNLLDPENEYNKTGYAAALTKINTIPDSSSASNPLNQTDEGMAVKAEPNPAQAKTGSFSPASNSKKYMIWKWDNALTLGAAGVTWPAGVSGSAITAPPAGSDNPSHANYSDYLDYIRHLRYTVVTFNGTTLRSIGSAVVIEADDDEEYQWLVTVDVHTRQLEDLIYSFGSYDENGVVMSSGVYGDSAYGNDDRGYLVRGSMHYPVYLDASDTSGSAPLIASYSASLPIDNNPPKAEYTLNRRPAGVSQAIGGEAFDEGPVNGVGKIVLWFSRGTAKVPESWRSSAGGAFIPHSNSLDFTNSNPNLRYWNWVAELDADVLPAGLVVPAIPHKENTAALFGNSAIVIDNNTPMQLLPRYGQALTMGFSSGGAGKIWYFDFNSTLMPSGPVTMHYVVMDTAGNARYYEDKIIIMNKAPLIDRIWLGTDLRNMSALHSALQAGTNTNKSSITGSIFDQIRSTVPLPPEVDPDDPAPDKVLERDLARGITDYISSSALAPEHMVDFSARNNLLALRVETAQEPDSTKARRFRMEYVSGARLIKNNVREVKAGRVYIVDSDPRLTTARLGGLGAEGDGPWPRGYAFLAATDGERVNFDGSREAVVSGTVDLWELNPDYAIIGDRTTASGVPPLLRIPDANYDIINPTPTTYARNAEFVYNSGAFGTVNGGAAATIVDFNPDAPYPELWRNNEDANDNRAVPPPERHSLFILKVFDGPEEDLFCDFALLRIRVNNNDQTKPFAQLYDINPYTEGQDVRRTMADAVAPDGMGRNRTKGGLWNLNTNQSGVNNWRIVSKPGHIEPRVAAYPAAPFSGYNHSLSPREMGGPAAGTYTSSWDYSGNTVNKNAFFRTDTVSGRVILRGYVEDDQLLEEVRLMFTPVGSSSSTSVTILEADNQVAIDGKTGFLKVPAAQIVGNVPKVYFTDTLDVRRHRVEWAYVWDTETIPTDFVVGTATVRAVAYNKRTGSVALERKTSRPMILGVTSDPDTGQELHTAGSVNNPGFPVNLYEYNTINFNLRPYITGIRRDQSKFYNNYRSLQGRVALSRGETPVILGFNLGRASGATTTVSLNNAPDLATSALTGTQPANYAVDGAAYRARILSSAIPRRTTFNATGGDLQGAQTGDGKLVLNVLVGSENSPAVNTGSERPLLNAEGNAQNPMGGNYWIQPWNREYSQGVVGSDLWDDYTSVHIWESEGRAPGGTDRDSGYFRSTNDHHLILNPAMSINTTDGVLWGSHVEGVAGNLGRAQKSNNTGSAMATALSFGDPIIYSDIYRSPGDSGSANDAATWVTAIIFGAYAPSEAASQNWNNLGGAYISGPGGAAFTFAGGGVGGDYYHAESTWYNASTQSTGIASPPTTEQFANPRIVTSYGDAAEHIHLAYYDTKDQSLKYAYNTRDVPGLVNGGTTSDTANDVRRTWVNLDGGFDDEDWRETSVSGRSDNIKYRISEAAGSVIQTSVAAVQYHLSTEASRSGWGTIPDGSLRNYHLGNRAAANGYGTINTTADAADAAVAQSRFSTDATAWNYGTIPAGTTTRRFLSQEAGGTSIPTGGTAQNIRFSSDVANATPPAGAVSAGTTSRRFLSEEIAAGVGPINTSTTAVDIRLSSEAAQQTPPVPVPSAGTTSRRFLSEEITAQSLGTVPNTATATTVAAQEIHLSAQATVPSDTLQNYHLGTRANNGTAPTAAIHGGMFPTTSATTSYSLNNGDSGGTIPPANFRYIREVANNPRTGSTWQENDFIFYGEELYRFGSGDNVLDPTRYSMRATSSGRIAAIRPVNWQATTPAGTADTTRVYAITTFPINFVRAVHGNLTNGSFVTEGTLVYTIGAADPAVTDGQRTFTAPAAGYITNIVPVAINVSGNYTATITAGTQADGGITTAAQRLFSITTIALNYVREVHTNPQTGAPWAAGDYVVGPKTVNGVQVPGDLIYTLGENPNTVPVLPSTSIYSIRAPVEGVITNISTRGMRIVPTGTVAGVPGAATNTRLFTITPAARNLIRQVHNNFFTGQPHANHDYVRGPRTENGVPVPGDLIYTLGIANPSVAHARATTYEIRALADGTLSNMKLATTITTAGATFGNYNNAITVTGNTLDDQRLYTITTGATNHVRIVHDNPATRRPWEVNDYVLAGEAIYTIGEHPNVPGSTDSPDPVRGPWIYKARTEGALTNLSSRGHRFNTGTTAAIGGTPGAVGTAANAENGTPTNPRLYTVTPLAFNYIRAVGINFFTGEPHKNHDYVRGPRTENGVQVPGDVIYTIGVRNPNAVRASTFIIRARASGTLSNVKAAGMGTGADAGLFTPAITTAAGLAETGRLYTITTGATNHVRIVHENPSTRAPWAEGDYIRRGEDVYTIGEHPSVDPTSLPTYIFKAQAEGGISNLSSKGHRFNIGTTAAIAGTPGAVGTAADADNGTATNPRLYTIAPAALNYIREVHTNFKTGRPFANNDYVEYNTTIYTLGAPGPSNNRSEVYYIRAQASGTLSNMKAATLDASGQYNTAITVTGTDEVGRLYTITTGGMNHVRQVHNNPDASPPRPWQNDDYVRVGDLIYTIGEHRHADGTMRTYEFRARREGVISNLSSVDHRFDTSSAGAVNNGTPGAVSNANTATNGTATNMRLYTIRAVPLNYLREVKINDFTDLPWANTNYVTPEDGAIYVIGAANPAYTRATTYEFGAPVAGHLSNMRTATTSTTAGATFGHYNTQITVAAVATDGGTAATEANRLFTIAPIALNYVRQVHVSSTAYVKPGTLIYTLGQQNNPTGGTPTIPTTYSVFARSEGTLSNVSSVGQRIVVSGIVSGDPGATTNARLFTITPIALNYLRYVIPTGIARGTTVTKGDLIYIFGARDPSNTVATQYEVRAPRSGVIAPTTAAGVTAPEALYYAGNSAPQAGGFYSNQAGTPNTTFAFTILPNDYMTAPRMVQTSPPRFTLTSTGPELGTNVKNDVGFHNAIAITEEGYPVIAYFDATNQRLKMAVSRKFNPQENTDWVIRDYVIPRGNPLSTSTGQFISIKINHIDGGTGNEKNRVHMTALNSQRNQLVYMTGLLHPKAGTGNVGQDDMTASADNVLTNIDLRIVDNVGVVGRWSILSLDENGYPWIAYMDEVNRGSMDGVKMAFYNPSLFKKGVNDEFGQSLSGWERMHVPARFRVENQVIDGRENGRLGIECFPTRNNYASEGNSRFWSAAIGYLGTGTNPDDSTDTGVRTRYRIAYYVK